MVMKTNNNKYEITAVPVFGSGSGKNWPFENLALAEIMAIFQILTRFEKISVNCTLLQSLTTL